MIGRGNLDTQIGKDVDVEIFDFEETKNLLGNEIQATPSHSRRIQLVERLGLPDRKLILPAANIPLAEKLIELLNILQPAKRRLPHLLKPNLRHHALQPLLCHLDVQECRNPFDLPGGIPLQILKGQEQDVVVAWSVPVVPARAPPAQRMLEPIAPLHLPATKHAQPHFPVRLEESAPTLPALEPVVAEAHILGVPRDVDIPARPRGRISAQRHRVRHMRLKDARIRRHVQVRSGARVCPRALDPMQGAAQRVAAAVVVEIAAG